MEQKTGAEELRRTSFRRNNRTVLQTINVMREDYTPLESVADALEGTISYADVTDCVNYLTESGYIKLRIRGSQTAVTDLPTRNSDSWVQSSPQREYSCLTAKSTTPA